MPVGQPVVVALVLRQAVAVHLGQEAEVVGQGEVPDLQRDRQLQSSCSEPRLRACSKSASRSPRYSPAARPCGTYNLDVQALILWRQSAANAWTVQRHDRVGQWPELAGNQVIAAELDLDRLAGRAFEDQRRAGWMRRDSSRARSRTWKATNSFRAAWSVIWRLAAFQRWLAAR